MSTRKITDATQREILRLRGEGLSGRKIAARLGVAATTANRYISGPRKPPARSRPGVGPKEVDAYECAGCKAAGRRALVTLRPCVVCAATAVPEGDVLPTFGRRPPSAAANGDANMLRFPLGEFEYKGKKTIKQLRRQLQREEIARVRASGESCPTPGEIAERTAEVRKCMVDEKGVLAVSPCDHDRPEEPQAGIRVCKC